MISVEGKLLLNIHTDLCPERYEPAERNNLMETLMILKRGISKSNVYIFNTLNLFRYLAKNIWLSTWHFFS